MNASADTRTMYYPLELRRSHVPTAPSARNREMFRQVKVFRRKQADVARQFGCSPQRLTRILQQVSRWLDFTGGHEEPCVWNERMAVQEYVHRERLECLREDIHAAFKLSCQERVTKKIVKVDGVQTREEVISRQPFINPRWLDLVHKVDESRIAFEERRGTIDPPLPEVESDAEKIKSPSDIGSQAYFDRRPAAEEFCDVREMKRRLEKKEEELELREEFLQESSERLEETRREFYASMARRQEEARVEKSLTGQAAVKMAVGTPDEETASTVPLSTGGASGTQAGEKPSLPPQFSDIHFAEDPPHLIYQWRYATQEEFSVTRRCANVRIRLEAAARRRKYLAISHGPPLEVNSGVWIMVEPHPLEGRERQKFLAEWRRREAEYAAAGEEWYPPPYKFDAEGRIVG